MLECLHEFRSMCMCMWVGVCVCVLMTRRKKKKNGKFIPAKPEMDDDELSGESYATPAKCQYAKNW